MTETIADLEGHLVYVYVKGLSKGYDDGIVLESCQLRTIGGRKFLVGRSVERTQPEWTNGPETSIAWDAVTTFLVYPTRDALIAASNRAAPDGKPRGVFSRIFGGG